jgi:putative OmpL-like beta-barrel porin-2
LALTGSTHPPKAPARRRLSPFFAQTGSNVHLQASSKRWIRNDRRAVRLTTTVVVGLGLFLGAGREASGETLEVVPASPAESGQTVPAAPSASEPGPVQKQGSSPTEDAAAGGPATAARLEALAKQNEALMQRLEELESQQKSTDERVDQLLPLKNRISGYIDFGFFDVQGDGRGIRSDLGHQHLPQYAGVPDSWVFMGDPLSTAINSRGDPANVAESRAITFNPIGNGGQPTFLLNAINVQFFQGVGDNLTVNAGFDLLPRSRNISNPDGNALGDYLDVKLAYAEYRIAIGNTNLSLYAGKFDSVLGYEYRSQESPDRLTVTPSLICRYTCGHPLGLKARWQLLDDALVLNAALSNGSHFNEGFDFADELDSNAGKTAAGRLSFKFPLGSGVELGASGAYGTQDAQAGADPKQWHLGFDAHAEWADLNFTAELVKGKAEGRDQPGEPPCGVAPCIEYTGAYGLLGYRVNNWLMPYVRSDYRKAIHQSGASFVYHSQLARGTGGVRVDLGSNIILKAEYTLNRELGAIPQFDNDLFTSSLVAKW